MQALILAGGKGTRLRPYTTVIPKPLMPVGDRPILEILLRQLKHFGFEDIVLAVGHQSHLIRAFFDDGSRLGLRIDYTIEEEPLGTAGPIAMVLDRMDDQFLVLNGDLLTTLNLGRLWQHHLDHGGAVTIGLYQRDVPIDFGVVESTADGCLVRYIEKPTYHFDVSMGVNVFTRARVAPFLTPGAHLDIPQLLSTMTAAGEVVRCYREDCYWLDIGRHEDYQTANEIFGSRQAEFLPGGAGT